MREQRQDTLAPSERDEEAGEEVMPLEEDEAEPRRSDTRGRRRFVSTIPARVWITIAFVCLFAAVVCLLAGRPSAAFVVGVLGVVAWFLNVRAHLRNANLEDEEAGDED